MLAGVKMSTILVIVLSHDGGGGGKVCSTVESSIPGFLGERLPDSGSIVLINESREERTHENEFSDRLK